MSSEMRRNFLKERSASGSLWRSARETSKTRPFKPSEAIPEKQDICIFDMREVKDALTGSLGSVDQCLANLAVGEHGWGFHIIPVLTCERINAEINNYESVNFTAPHLYEHYSQASKSPSFAIELH